MYQFDDDIEYECSKCGHQSFLSTEGIELFETGYDETHYFTGNCEKCSNIIGVDYSISSRKEEDLIITITRIAGMTLGCDLLNAIHIINEPMFISRVRNMTPEQYAKTLNLISELQENFKRLPNITRREFEEIIAVLMERKGFKVELTQQTRDGGKDIIGIKNIGGIPFKIFVECKHPNPGTPVSVDLVRTLYGVHNTQNSPNKSIMVTSSYYSHDARKFVNNETNSQWDIGLYDYDHLKQWIDSY